MDKMEMIMPIRSEVATDELKDEEVADVLRHEEDFFEVPEELKDRANEAVEIGDLLTQTSDLLNDDPKEPRDIPIKVYRSKEWLSPMKKDADYVHPVVYWADIAALSREYLPDDLSQTLDKKYKTFKEKYPLFLMGEEEEEALWKKIYERSATTEERAVYERRKEQFEMFSREYEDYRKASILNNHKVEKRIMLLKKPLIIRGYKYEGEKTFDRSEFGIRDIRYLRI